MSAFNISENERRAIRFVGDGRKTMATRDEARNFIAAAVEKALRDARYRFNGPQVSEAEANGANPDAVVSA